MRALETVGANVLGTIMNNMKDSREAIYQGYANLEINCSSSLLWL